MSDKYVTVAGAGTKAGGSWGNAMDLAAWIADWAATVVAGDIYYLMQGTYTLGAGLTTLAGSTTAPITIVGVPTGTTAEPPVYADWSDANLSGGSDNRPILSCGSNAVQIIDYHKCLNVIFKTTATNGVQLHAGSKFYNCKFEASSSTNDRYGAYGVDADITYVSCEFCGLVGTGVVCRALRTNALTKVLFSYFHDCRTGYYSSSTRGVCHNNNFEDCSVAGVDLASTSGHSIVNNAIHDCATGISGGTAAYCDIINNILEGCTVGGIIFTAQSDTNFIFGNHGDDSRNVNMWDFVAVTSPHGDMSVTTGDPLFDGDGNLSLQTGSPCRNVALQSVLGT